MSKASSRRLAAAALLAAATIAGSASCYWLTATRIGSILEKPAQYDGKTVTVYGTVKERIDLPRLKCYILGDGSGEIAVDTSGPLPSVGQKMHARGRVQASFAIAKRKIVGIIEPLQPRPTPREPPPGAVLPN